MIIGVIVASVGTGLLPQIGVDTSTVQWAVYLIVAGQSISARIESLYTAL